MNKTVTMMLSTAALAAAAGTATPKVKPVTIPLNDGRAIPQFGLGTYNSSVAEAKDALAVALKLGYRHVDTAHAYRNERGVGAAVKESGIPREEIWITSKLWPTDYDHGNAAESIDKMLERLGVDYIDLVYLHQPVGDYMAGWRGLEEAVKQGKIKSIGISNFDMDERAFDEIIAKAKIRPAIVQIELHPYAQRKAFREKCKKLGIAVEGWFPLGGTDGNATLFGDKTIKELAAKYKKSPAQIILRWHVQEGFSTIPGARNPDYIKENIEVYNFKLSEDDMKKIRGLDKEKRFFTSTLAEIQHFKDWNPGD
ncbi:MAG: aldo/keto reductase [Fibrobacter sp.]|nr:aldo/keto reductase [Fibrobacter sp.]